MDVLAKKILDLNFDPKSEEARVILSQVRSVLTNENGMNLFVFYFILCAMCIINIIRKMQCVLQILSGQK